MSDHEPSGFKIVDRRQSVAENGDASHSETPESSAQETWHIDAGIGNPHETPTPPISDPPPHDGNDVAEEAGDQAAYDPSVLLSIAAMQMDIQTLAITLLPIFDGHAWRAMGFLVDPKTGATGKDLPTAQLAIDCVQFFLSKVEHSLPDSERREMQRRLTDLRMNYLSKLREG